VASPYHEDAMREWINDTEGANKTIRENDDRFGRRRKKMLRHALDKGILKY
jgi:hypothetical protein